MRSILLSVAILCGWMFVIGFGFEGCTPTIKPGDDKTTPTDSGTPKDEPTRRPPSTVCKPGNKINSCEGSGKCTAQRDCDGLTGKDLDGTCYDGVCVPNPTTDAKIEKGTIDVSCLATPPELPKGPEKAMWVGPVETFGLNSNTTGITVEIFDYEADPELKSPLGTFVSEAPTKKGGDCASACADGRVCFYGSCVKPKDENGNEIGYFEIDGLPTNKLLVIRTTGPNLVATIQYNLWIPADKVKKIGDKDLYSDRAFAVTVLTRGLIPPTAGIRLPKSDEAVIAGEIHDCNGKPVEGARVSITLTPLKLAYFNGDAENPDPDQEWTNRDGIYAALNVKVNPPGDILVRAVVKVGGKQHLLGKFKAKLFQDSATIVTTSPWYPGIK